MRSRIREYTIDSEFEMNGVAKDILDSQHGKLFFLRGDLGAGKTALVKALCNKLNCEDHTSSPTFSLVNEYHCPSGKIYHIDLYRLDSLDEALEIGIEDYLSSQCYCFIEWPEVIDSLVSENYVDISIECQNRNTRNLLISYE